MYCGFSHDQVSERAYYLWLEIGKPDGQSNYIWMVAQIQLSNERCSGKICNIDGNKVYIVKQNIFLCSSCLCDYNNRSIANIIEWIKYAERIFPRDIVIMINKIVLENNKMKK